MQITAGNVIDLILLVLFLFAIVRGWKTGLLIKLAHLAVIIIAGGLSHGIAVLLKESAGSAFIIPLLEKKGGQELLSFPYMEEGITYAAENIAYYIIASVCFFLIVIVLYQLIKVLRVVDYIPIVGVINKAGGALGGFLTEFAFCYIIGAVACNLIPQNVWLQWGLSQEVIANTYLLQAFLR